MAGEQETAGEAMDPGREGARPPRPVVPGYDIQAPLGEGAMGVVWRATQLSTQRTVALKLLPSTWLGSREMRLRFEREVEIAASLEHPHIARVYDSGLREGGYFYAMQLVEGVPLDAYVEQHHVAERDLLALCAVICDAVNHAHLRGVIHRDLKPSNIMVTGEGEPFVLDFGLAKPVSASPEQVQVSMAGDLTGTPQFMSPEQARGDGTHLDTRTDVYSLGVMLYRLLTGHFPHETPGGYLELLQHIAGDDPVRPSRYLRDLHPDLEAILLRAVARSREERYASAGALAADLRHYLAREPVSARAITPAYVTRTWLRKHRAGVSVAAAVALSMLVVAGVSVFRIRQERDVAQANFGVARAAVQDFFVKIGDRELDRVPGMTGLRLLLLQAASGYYQQLVSRQPNDVHLQEERARILNVLAEQQFMANEITNGVATLQQALALQERVLQAEPTNSWVMLMMALGHDRLARLGRDRGDGALAETSAAQAMALKNRLAGAATNSTALTRMLAYSFDQEALDLRQRGEDERASAAEAHSLELKKQLVALQPKDQVSLRMLAHQYSELADFQRNVVRDLQKAKELQLEALEINQQLALAAPDDAANQRMLAHSLSALAKHSRQLREYELGRSIEQKAQAIKQVLYERNPGNPDGIEALAYSLTEIASYDIKLGELEPARDLLTKAVQFRQQLVAMNPGSGSYQKSLAFSIDQQAALQRRAGQTDEALALYDQAYAMLQPLRRKAPSDNKLMTTIVCNRLFRLDALLDVERMDEVEQSLPEIEALMDQWTPESPLTIFFHGRLLAIKVQVALGHGRAEEAAALADQAIDHLRRALQPGFVPTDSPFEVTAYRALQNREDFLALRPAYLAAMAGSTSYAAAPIRQYDAGDTDALLAAEHQFVTVTGIVAQCTTAPGGNIFFLNFDAEGRGLFAVLRRENLGAFAAALGPDPVAALSGRAVTLSGALSVRRGRPCLDLLWSHQLALHGAGSVPTADAAVSAATASAPDAATAIDWRQAGAYVGKLVVVTGTVFSAKNIGRMCFLDFAEQSEKIFRLPVYKETYAAWPVPPQEHFLRKNVRVTGKVILFGAFPEIEVRDPAQIEILPDA